MIQTSYETNASLPSYVRVARDLHQMLSGMQINERLKPERELCVQLGISRVTLRRSLEYFHKQGILEARPGRGTWLARPVPLLSLSRDTPSNLIGLVVSSLQQPSVSRVVQGAERYAAGRGYHIALAHDHNDCDYQIQQLRRMAESSANGIAVYPYADNLQRKEFLALLRSIKEKEIPLVMIDQYAPEVASACVLSDNFQGSFMATQHLILNGHRKLGLLAFGPVGGVSDRGRRKGFIAALENHGLKPEAVRQADMGSHDFEIPAQQMVQRWLRENGGKAPFDGLVCMQDNIAYGAYLALREAGLRVPEDIALIGYDNYNRELYQAAGLHLTSIDQPLEQIGEETVRLLISAIEKRAPEIRDSHLLLKPRLIVRTSCGSNPPH